MTQCTKHNFTEFKSRQNIDRLLGRKRGWEDEDDLYRKYLESPLKLLTNFESERYIN